jgi:hypothetical protein
MYPIADFFNMVVWFFNSLKNWQNLWHFAVGFMLIITVILLLRFDKVFAYLTYVIFNALFVAFQYLEDWHTGNNSSFDILCFGYGQATAIAIVLAIFFALKLKQTTSRG